MDVAELETSTRVDAQPVRARIRALLTTVEGLGGVARVRTVLDAGNGRYALRAAIAEGRLLRIRRDWIALPTADRYLIAAARAGVVVSCITQARRLGLWVLEESNPHVAVNPHRVSRAVGATVHSA